MKKYYFLSLFILMFSTLASAVVELQLAAPKISQGSLETVVFKVDPATAQQFELQKLKGQTIGNTIYIYSISPLMRKEGGETFEAEARIVFIKVPETPFVAYKAPQGEIVLTWKDLEVIPTEAQKELIFGTFEVPERSKILLWAGIFVILALIVLCGFPVWRKIILKKELKNKKLGIKNDIYSVGEYQDVVRIWQNKRNLVREFPHLEEPFKNLEKTLFKHQFKPSQTESEKTEVMSAWKKFMEESQGGFNGI